MKPFVPSSNFTLGVEEEYQLCDAVTGELASKVDDVLGRCRSEKLKRRLCYELFLSVLETNTEICQSVDEVVEEISQRRTTLAKICGELGVVLCATGAHPFSRWQDQEIVPTAHYQWVVEHVGFLARRNLAFGLHIHVGVDDPEGSVYTLYMMQRWLAQLLALSANSPFLEGRATGLASTRMHLFGSLPRTGFPPAFKSYRDLEAHVDKMVGSGIVNRPGALWWNIRPQPPLGTIEVRICDLQDSVERMGALTALVQALVATYMEQFHGGVEPCRHRREYLEQNKWSAMRFGLDGKMIDPETQEVMDTRQAVSRMLALAQPKIESFGTSHHVEHIHDILERGNGTTLQMQLLEDMKGDFRAFQLEMAKRSIPDDQLPVASDQ